MIGWCMALGILLVVCLLLLLPVVCSVAYRETGGKWQLSYLGLTLLNSENTGVLQKRRKTSLKAKKGGKNKPKKAKKHRTLKDYWQIVQEIVPALPKPLRLLWKGISIRNLVLGVQVGKFDARACALAYGKANGMVYTTLGFLQSIMRVKTEQITVQCAFGQEKTRWVVQGKLCVTPLAAVAALLSFFIGYSRNTAMQKQKSTAAKETAAEQ